MAVTITSITPPRGRAADRVTIAGTGFVASPAADNLVTADGNACTLVSATATQLVVDLPSFTNRDGFIAIMVEIDGGEPEDQAIYHWWAKPNLDEMADVDVPGQVPGPGEDVDTRQADVAGAKDFEAAATLAEYLAREVLAYKGDLFTHDGTGIVRFPAGGTGEALEARPLNDQGLAWSKPEHTLMLPWGRLVASGENTLLAMVANGDATATATTTGEHGVPIDGMVDALWVLCEEEASTDTLDQVTLTKNGVTVHDSGTGLARAQDGSYRTSALTVNVTAGDRLELRAKKLGTAALMRLIGGVRIIERRPAPSDAIVAPDAMTRTATFARVPTGDTVDVGDAVAAVKT